MRYDRLNRRLFLIGAGGAALALPFLPSLLPRELRRTVEAQPPTPPRRFLAMKTYNELPVRDWYPMRAPAGYMTDSQDGTVRCRSRLAEPSGRHSDGRTYYGNSAPLSDFAATGFSNVFGTGFNRFHDKMLVLRGLDVMPNLNHNDGGILGNFGMRTAGVGGPLPGAQINVTIDQVMAQSPNVYAGPPPGPRILHLGSRRNTFSFAPRDPSNLLATGAGAVQQAQAYVNPRTAFDAVLAGVGPSMMPAEPSLSVRLIDRVIDDYRGAATSPNLGSADRQLLDQHVTRLTELEARLSTRPMSMGCSPPSAPSSLDTGGEFDVDVGDVTTLFQDMVDIAAAAMICDVTRIVTLDVTKMVVEDGGDTFGMGDSQNADSAGRSNWHFQAHTWDDNAIRWMGLGTRWVANAVLLRLLDALEGAMESDGQSVLHHSAVMWNSELSFNHLNYSIPTALWGRAGGWFNTGRYVDYIDYDRSVRFAQHDGKVIEGLQYNRMMVTLMQAMGVTPSEYEISPGRGFGETRPIEKGDGFALDYDDSNVGEVLPDLRA